MYCLLVLEQTATKRRSNWFLEEEIPRAEEWGDIQNRKAWGLGQEASVLLRKLFTHSGDFIWKRFKARAKKFGQT